MSEANERRDRLAKLSERLNSASMGKLPPQAPDFEEAVLGALLLDREAIYAVTEYLKPASFYLQSHQSIFEAILFLHSSASPVDMLTVSQRLREQGDLETIGGAYYLTELTSRVSSAANIEYHAQIITQKFIQRELIRECSELINAAYDDMSDPFELLSRAGRFLDTVNGEQLGQSEQTMEELAVHAIRRRDEKSSDGITGIETGLPSLDRFINGLCPNKLIIVAARPSMGKTAVICTMAAHICVEKQIPGVLFSLEMSASEIFTRIQSNVAGINGRNIIKNQFTDGELKALSTTDSRLMGGKLIVDDNPTLTSSRLRAKLAVYKRRYGIRVAFIDYLQLFTPENPRANREQQVSDFSRTCKLMSKELGIPIVLLSQLSRETEKRTTKLPQLSDLRESGAIEQDADTVIFLHRPEYYNMSEPTHFKNLDKTIDNRNLLIFLIAKQRDGEVGALPYYFEPWIMRIADHPDARQSDIDFKDERDSWNKATPHPDSNITANNEKTTNDDLPF